MQRLRRVKVEELYRSAFWKALSLIRLPPSLSQRNGTALISSNYYERVSANRLASVIADLFNHWIKYRW